MDLSDAYENGAYIPNAGAFVARWADAAAAFRAEMGMRFVEGFDLETRRGVDLALPEGTPRGLLVFVHGGYWMKFSPRDWSHLARGAVTRGWAVAVPGYPLCPQVRVRDITSVVAAGIADVAKKLNGPIVLTGHSAGGHLVARMAEVLPEEVRARVQRIAPISMLSDLAPLMQTKLNETLGLDAAEARAESPLHAPRPPGVDIALWVGAAERPAFLDQSRWQAEAWDVPLHIPQSRHHFDVIEALEDPDSEMVRWLVE
ncbi:alpha/beta hydrolase [Roseobacteraceae bacterium S113]